MVRLCRGLSTREAKRDKTIVDREELKVSAGLSATKLSRAMRRDKTIVRVGQCSGRHRYLISGVRLYGTGGLLL